MTAMRLSVIICTHNRASDLDRALRSLGNQATPWEGREVIVVDNASTDDTSSVARRWQERLPVRYVVEPTLGLCHARNAGWRTSGAPLIAYLDDDARAAPGWTAAIEAAFDAGGERLGCVGGKVDPIWEAPRPAWLADSVALGLTIVDWSEHPRRITDLRMEWLVGANLALRRAAIEAVGGFEPALDRVGERMLSSGDVYLVKQVMQRGFVCEYHPAMLVEHRVPAARLEQRWFRQRYYWQGISDAVMELLDSRPSGLRRAGLALQRTARLLRQPARLVSLARRTTDPAAFAEQCWTLIALGHVAGLLGAGGR